MKLRYVPVLSRQLEKQEKTYTRGVDVLVAGLVYGRSSTSTSTTFILPPSPTSPPLP